MELSICRSHSLPVHTGGSVLASLTRSPAPTAFDLFPFSLVAVMFAWVWDYLNLPVLVLTIVIVWTLQNAGYCKRSTEDEDEEDELPEPQRILERPADPNRIFTIEELRTYDGKHSNVSPIYLAAKGLVYDVTHSGFYGPAAAYPALAGRDCSVALAKMDLGDTSDTDMDFAELGGMELGIIEEWVEKYQTKYELVGRVKDSWWFDEARQAETRAIVKQKRKKKGSSAGVSSTKPDGSVSDQSIVSEQNSSAPGPSSSSDRSKQQKKNSTNPGIPSVSRRRAKQRK